MDVSVVKSYVLGISLCVVMGAAAIYATGYIQMPVMLAAIIIGLIFHGFDAVPAFKNGINWCSKNLLYIGVALMGLRIDFGDLSQVGFAAPALVIFTLGLTLIAGFYISRAFGETDNFSILMSGSVAICGVSAAAAICASLDDHTSRNQELAITVAGITILSTAVMMIFPVLAHALDLSDLGSGILMGGGIHNVSQAVGAGYAVSENAGDLTVLLKLMRVSMLLPIVFIVSVTWGKNAATPYPNMGAKIRANSPKFLVVFFILALLSCFHLVPSVISNVGNEFARLALIVSLVAIGIKTALKDVVTVGAKPLMIMTLITVMMTGILIAGIYLIGAA